MKPQIIKPFHIVSELVICFIAAVLLLLFLHLVFATKEHCALFPSLRSMCDSTIFKEK